MSEYQRIAFRAIDGPVSEENLEYMRQQSSRADGLGSSLIAAAAQDGPRLAARVDPRNQYTKWLQGQPQATKDAWLTQCMADAHSSVRRDMLAEFRRNRGAPSWPTIRRDRTIAELEAAAEGIQHQADRQAAADAASQKAERLASMAADPAQTLRETEKLVTRRSTDAYHQIATLLAELREALADSKQSGLAEKQAQKLKKDNPTLHLLTSELRRQGFVPK